MPFTIVRLGLFFFNLEISELDWNRNRISCYVFIHYTYNFLSDEITRNCFFHFSKKIRFTRVLLIISRIQTMDVKLLSESPFVFPFSFYPCMWTSVFFLLHPVCFSALRLFCLALFMWLPVALSYVNLVRGRTLQTTGCGEALCGGEERLLHTQAALSSVTSLRLFFSQVCREVVLLGWLWTQWDCCPVFHGRDIRNHLLNWVWNQNSKTKGKTIVWCLCGSQLEFILPTLERFWDFSSFWLCEYSTEKQNTILC